MESFKDNENTAFYNYDASGERNLKLTGGTVDVTQNGYTMNVPVFDQQTLYASALVTINDKGYTKHYFEEGKRICSKIGSGGLHDLDVLVDQMEMEYYKQIEVQRDGIYNTFNECIGGYPEIQNEDIFATIKKYHEENNPDEPGFWYHSDHLGSASYITDDHGHETQHLVYLPFGEDWVDMKYNTSQFDTPYKFNGKEKDPETGLHYYGARYLNTDLSIWLSVDPMSDKYPSTSSYAYCRNNPIMLVDPDGRDYDLVFNHNDKTVTISGVYFSNDRSYESNKRATNYWNNQSGNYSYRDGESKSVYKINFDLQAIPDKDYNESHANTTNKNVYEVVDDIKLNPNQNGKTNNNWSKVKESRKKTNTGAHEMGHTLGLGHYFNGLMSDEKGNRTDKITKEYIKDIFNNALNRNPDPENNLGVGNVKNVGKSPDKLNEKKTFDIFTN